MKSFLSRYTLFVWGALKPLGAWGVFAIAGIDASFFGMPLDPVVGSYVYMNPHRFWLYVLMAAAGSALGSIFLYVLGYKGGEVLLEKRIGRQRLEQIRNRFAKQEFFALMIPAMMPPPFPFKLFLLAAAVFEMKFGLFLLAIFLGRVARFMILSLLVIEFGPSVVGLVGNLLRQHLNVTLGVLAAVVAVGVWLWLRWGQVKRPVSVSPETSD